MTFTNPDDAADAIDNYDLNELPGYAGRGKFLKCSVANINKFAAVNSDKKFDRPGESCIGLWGEPLLTDVQCGNQRNGYKSMERRMKSNKDRKLQKKLHRS